MSGFKDHFSTLAAQYAQSRPRYPGELFGYLASVCEARRDAWDCACGSGQATLSLAEHFESVVGTDASARQVEEATPHPRVTYRVAPAEASGLGAASMDLVTVAQSLHWFDIDRFYAEARRVLRPGGVLAVWSYGIQAMDDPALDREVQRFYHDVVGPYWPPERALVEEGYRSLRFPFEERAPPAFTLREQWPLAHLLGYFRSWSATGRYVKANGADPVAELEERMAPSWGDPQSPRLVVWPLALRVGVSR
jgi:SAM-dependent methyltransferase